jgi:mitogen-activated protein kinase kinase 4/5
MPKLSISDFELVSKLGSGATGTVYKAQLKNNCEEVGESHACYAIKVIKLEKKCMGNIQEVFKLKNVEHPNIVKCHTSFFEDGNLYIVMEYA